jgi:hypothetical protein
MHAVSARRLDVPTIWARVLLGATPQRGARDRQLCVRDLDIRVVGLVRPFDESFTVAAGTEEASPAHTDDETRVVVDRGRYATGLDRVPPGIEIATEPLG